MKTSSAAWIVAVIALVLVGGAWWLAEGSGVEPTLRLDPPVPEEVSSSRPGAQVARTPAASSRTEPPESAPPPTVAPRPDREQAAPRTWLVRGEVVDLRGEGLSGVELVLPTAPGAAVRATSSANGSYDLRTPRLGADVQPVSPEFAVAARARDVEGRHQRLVLSRSRSLAGRVEDLDGRPLPGVRVEATVSPSALADLSGTTLGMDFEDHGCETDEAGVFTLGDLPAGVEGRLLFSARAHRTRELAWPATDAPMHVRLDPLPAPVRVRGVVRDPSLEPVAGASVSSPGLSTRTGADGSFAAEVPLPPGAEVTAVHPTLGLASGLVPSGPGESGEVVLELVLRPARYQLAGHLLDAEQRPLSGWIISVLELRDGVWHDSLAGGRRAVEVDETDASGAFFVSGDFTADSVRLAAWNKSEGRSEVSRALVPVAGEPTHFEWTLPALRLHPAVDVVIQDSRGRPVPGASVTVRRARVLPAGAAEPDRAAPWRGPVTRRTTSDEAGVATLEGLPVDGAEIEVRSRGCVPARVRVSPGEVPPAHITLARTGEVLIRFVDLVGDPCSIEILNRVGDAVPVAPALSGFADQRRVEVDGVSPVRLQVGEGPHTLAVYDGPTLRTSRPIHVEAGRLTTVDL